MRVKLRFDSTLPLGHRYNKVCFYIGQDSCQNVGDLNYLIQKCFYNKSYGNVDLFLDEYYIPPVEYIDIIQENDVLNVQFVPLDNQGKRKQTSSAKNVLDDSSDSSSSEEEDEEEILPKKKKAKIDIKNNKPPVKSVRATATTAKKVIPLSQLGISKKKELPSSSSSSSSSESDSESDAPTKKSSVKTKQTNTAKTSSHLKSTATAKTANKKTTKPMKNVVKIDSSSSSDETTSSSESDSDDEISQTIPYSKTNSNVDSKVDSKVDFDIEGLSTNFTSTPGVLSASSRKISILKTPLSNANSFGKRVAAKDKYKNVSQVFTYTPDNSKNKSNELSNGSVFTHTPDLNKNKSKELNKIKKSVTEKETSKDLNNASVSENTAASISSQQDASIISIKENGFDSLVDVSNEKAHGVSGKTLRNRRRRKRKIEMTKQREEGTTTKGAETQGVDSVVDIVNDEPTTNEKNTNEPIPTVTQMPTNSENTFDNKSSNKPPTTQTNYEEYSIITECPPANSTIAFKVWGMDDKYQPFVSDYKEAKVVSYDKSSFQVELEMCNGFTIDDKRNEGRFEMEMDENTENYETEKEKVDNSSKNVFQDWKSILQIRLLKAAEDFEF